MNTSTFSAIPLSQIIDNAELERPLDPEEFKGLTASIEANGLLHPIGLAPNDDGTFLLVWGRSRFLAHQNLGLAEIAAHIVADRQADDLVMMALAENLHRSDRGLDRILLLQRYIALHEAKFGDTRRKPGPPKRINVNCPNFRVFSTATGLGNEPDGVHLRILL